LQPSGRCATLTRSATEGTDVTDRVSWGDRAYAGFWRRFVALLIDGLILSAIWGALAAVFSPAVLEPLDPQAVQVPPGYFAAVAGWSGVGIVIFVAY
jgi:uncharacterized RDD family membrane protein YckC